MRYYDILITNPTTNATLAEFTSLQGQFGNPLTSLADPAALDVEFDIPIAAQAIAGGDTGAHIKIWGIPRAGISQSSDLNGANIKVYGGMSKGLPLADPTQAGLLVQGTIFQAFGNWQGYVQTLELYLMPLPFPTGPQNFSFSVKAGDPVGPALENTLSNALSLTAKVDISDAVVFTDDVTHVETNLHSFSSWFKQASKNAVGGNYPGVDILPFGGAILAYDNSGAVTTTNIKFTDLVGQVTWIGPGQIQLNVVMRGDLICGNLIKLPPGQITTTQAAYSNNLNYGPNVNFQGTFTIVQMRHLGNFRQPDGDAWITTINALQALPGAGNA